LDLHCFKPPAAPIPGFLQGHPFGKNPFRMEHYLQQYGYLAVFVGAILEGGTLLTMAGFAAHQGYLKMLPWADSWGIS